MSIIFTDDILREAYDILVTEFEESLENPLDIFQEVGKTDILNVLIDKINNVKLSYELDEDSLLKLNNLEEKIYSTVLTKFDKEINNFINDDDNKVNIFEDIEDISLKLLSLFIYNNFYLNRTKVLEEFIIGKILNDKTSFSKRYKTPDTIKDITYKAIRSELNTKNQECYIILMYLNEIISDILNDENITVSEILIFNNPTESEEELTELLFSNTNTDKLIGQILSQSLLKNNEFLNNFNSVIKTRMFNMFKN
ncbi:MAG: hypothetical protein [Bacteriophage sp.]|nr:MAG: hypothetical protein [Bacteriophage sp.]